MITLIAAVGTNNELGKDDGVPLWNLPDEYKHFRQIIKGHPIIIGRKSYDVIGTPLENSLNIVVTRQKNYQANGALVAHSIEEAINKAGKDNEIFVIGGGDIFTMALPLAGRMEISRIDGTFPEAQAFFPEFSKENWKLVSSIKHEKDNRHAYSFYYQIWTHIKS